tara:strand:+ start:18843 stop:19181 length:339 start_codon:yes stop_codon:yes gene_type:complete
MMLFMSRVVVFAKDLDRLASFCGETLKLPFRGNREAGWREFDAGDCRIVLHKGSRGETPPRPTKIVFACDDVEATRNDRNGRGAWFGKVMVAGALLLCDGKDLEGNPIQLSN